MASLYCVCVSDGTYSDFRFVLGAEFLHVGQFLVGGLVVTLVVSHGGTLALAGLSAGAVTVREGRCWVVSEGRMVVRARADGR